MRGSKSSLGFVLAIGLLAGSAVGVAAQDEQASPVEFSATWEFGPVIRTGTSEAADGAIRERGWAWQPSAISAATDPRLEGSLSIAANSDDYGARGGPQVWHYGFRIENEEGAWQMLPTASLTYPDGEVSPTVGIFVGEGAYEGLHAVFEHQTDGETGVWELRGYVIEGELPPAPEPVLSD